MPKQRVRTADEVLADPEAAKLLMARAQELLAIEQHAALLKQQKADLFDIIRDDKLDPAHAKVWVAEQMRDADKEERARVKSEEREMILTALGNVERNEGRARARVRATGVPTAADDRAQRSKARLSESMADHKDFSSELASAGLISPEAHAENIAIADGVARKLGAGVLPAHDAENGEITEPAAAPAGAGATGAEAQAATMAAPVATHTETPPPNKPPVAQDEGQPENDRKGSDDSAVGDRGTHCPAQSEQFVATSGAGEGEADGSSAATPRDPAPASNGFNPRPGDPFLDPSHKPSRLIREAVCAKVGIEDSEFDQFRELMIVHGKNPAAALYVIRTGG